MKAMEDGSRWYSLMIEASNRLKFLEEKRELIG